MLHTIQNAQLSVTVNDLGAQLWSILGADGTQFLWQGDPKYWADRALTLFPFVARLWQGSYTLDSQTYHLPIHGFAPESGFALIEKTESRMVLELRDSEKTLAQYPRRFAFRVIYALHGAALTVCYEVENLDDRAMFFALGGHPGFNVPIESGKLFEDYRLRFGAPCAPVRVGFSEDCFVVDEDRPFPLEDGQVLALRHDLFDDDAIVLRDMAREVTLESEGGSRSVTVSFPDMPYLGIWHWPGTDAPYVCIEPWSSLPAKRGEITCMEEKADLIRLEPGKAYQNSWSIRING
ncbi:MAG: aldose 1-epimerase family protein [Clostridiales bacterium]|nr:aldose 1-epimerase family protein [Clostridiales bacterium]